MRRLTATLATRALMRCYSTKVVKLDLEPFPTVPNPNAIYQDKPDLAAIQQSAYVEYKTYPYLPHQDPKSKEYIHSELDEYHDRTEVEAFNSVIDQLKHDLKLQREVWDAIDKLDRTYKRGIPGVDRNIENFHGPVLEDIGFKRVDVLNDSKHTFSNEDAFISNTPFESNWEPSNIKEWKEEIKNRPVNRHYNHAKGYKYDVPVKPEDKYEFLADRLGHPELLGTPIDRLFKLENDIFHPEYIDQPFVKTPSPRPDPSLNFEEGEVIYENTRLLEWLKFWQLTVFTAAAYGVLFVPYQLVLKTHLVTPMADEIIPFFPYHYVSPFNVDTYHIGVPFITGIAAYGVYTVLNLMNKMTSSYVVKMSYSKDKELVFVKRIDLHGAVEEEVYEAAHLEILPPSARTSLENMSAQDRDGLTVVTCMNTQNELLLYNNKKHWNPNLRKQFFVSHLNLWDKSYYGFNRQEAAERRSKWEEELAASLNQKELPR